MKISIKVDDRAFLQALQRAPEALTRETRVGMKEALQVVQKGARDVHRFRTRSGQLERSIQQSVKSSGLSGRAYLEKGIAVYGPRIHTGWGTWSPDQFLYKAAEREKRNVVKRLEEAINAGLKRARLI